MHIACIAPLPYSDAFLFCADKDLTVLESTTGEIRKHGVKHAKPITFCQSVDETTLLTGCRDNHLRFFNTESAFEDGKELFALEHKLSVTCACVSPYRDLVASGSRD